MNLNATISTYNQRMGVFILLLISQVYKQTQVYAPRVKQFL